MVANLFGYDLYGKKLQVLSCPAEFRMRWYLGMEQDTYTTPWLALPKTQQAASRRVFARSLTSGWEKMTCIISLGYIHKADATSRSYEACNEGHCVCVLRVGKLALHLLTPA